MNHPEDNLQIACVNWFSYQYPNLILHHSPNGGKRNAIEAARFKRMGTRAGFPDLLLLVPSGGYHALFVELKAGKGSQSPNQKAFEVYCTERGYKYAICRQVDEFMRIVETYLAGEWLAKLK